MSVSDPLIKDIKGCILKFFEDTKESSYISDQNPKLVSFCDNVERVFNYGISSSYNAFGFTKPSDPWFWLEKISNCKDDIATFGFINSIENVKCYHSILSPVGKLRLLIRNCLVQKALHVPVEYLVKYKKCLSLYKDNSILGDEILSEIFLSLLLQCGKINFKLDLTNVAFLDKTWILPEVIKLELVPCRSLGLSVSFASNKAVIVNIKSNSVIAENSKIEVGDILDHLHGVQICLATKGRLNSILKTCKGQPVNVTIIKARFSNSNELYPPIVGLLKQVQIDPTILQSKSNLKNSDSNSFVKKSSSAGFKATYVGCVSTGKIGDVKQIDKACKVLLSPYKSQCSSPRYQLLKKCIYFEVGEIGVKVVDSETSEIMLKHSYMEISSCGSVSHMPHYFAYIAGNEYCNQATDFNCYVFHIKNSESAYTILQSIGQGFQRTHFAV